MFAKFLHAGQVQIEQLVVAHSPLRVQKKRQKNVTKMFKKYSKLSLASSTPPPPILKVHKHEVFFLTFFAETETIWS